MKPFSWDPAKNERLIRERGLSFEMILWSVDHGGLLAVLEHPRPGRYPGQKVLVVEAAGYVHLIPFEERETEVRLITIIPSRKARKKFAQE